MAAEGECMAVANEEESLYEMYWLIIIIVFLFFFCFLQFTNFIILWCHGQMAPQIKYVHTTQYGFAFDSLIMGQLSQ